LVLSNRKTHEHNKKYSIYKATNGDTQLADRNAFVLNNAVEILVNQPVRSVAV